MSHSTSINHSSSEDDGPSHSFFETPEERTARKKLESKCPGIKASSQPPGSPSSGTPACRNKALSTPKQLSLHLLNEGVPEKQRHRIMWMFWKLYRQLQEKNQGVVFNRKCMAKHLNVNTRTIERDYQVLRSMKVIRLEAPRKRDKGSEAITNLSEEIKKGELHPFQRIKKQHNTKPKMSDEMSDEMSGLSFEKTPEAFPENDCTATALKELAPTRMSARFITPPSEGLCAPLSEGLHGDGKPSSAKAADDLATPHQQKKEQDSQITPVEDELDFVDTYPTPDSRFNPGDQLIMLDAGYWFVSYRSKTDDCLLINDKSDKPRAVSISMLQVTATLA